LLQKQEQKATIYTITGQEVETLALLILSPEAVMAPPANEQMQERGKTTHEPWVVFPLLNQFRRISKDTAL